MHYVFFRMVSGLQYTDNFKRIGGFGEYVIAEASTLDNLPIKRFVTLSPEIALAWKYTAALKGYVKYRVNSNPNDPDIQSLIGSVEDDSEKIQYYLTDIDKTNTIALLKIYMKHVLDDKYNDVIQEIPFGKNDVDLISLEINKFYDTSNSDDLPWLSEHASVLNITLDECAEIYKNKLAAYNLSVVNLLAKKAPIESEIDSCNSLNACYKLLHLKFEWTLPEWKMMELAIQTESKLDIF